MIFKEAVGAVQRFVDGMVEVPDDVRGSLAFAESWPLLATYLEQLEAALDKLDKAAGTSDERPSFVYEFYERGLSRIRQHARRAEQ